MSTRLMRSGRSTSMDRSKRPGRSSALSSRSARLVPASTTTGSESVVPKPSISTSRAFSVFSRSSLPPARPDDRDRPMASISSMKTTDGAAFLACLNRSRTRDGPTPTNISRNSEPDVTKKGTPASPAAALASNVLPVPGGPANRAPLGILAPSVVYFSGFLRKSTNSCTSIFASGRPATSVNRTPTLSSRLYFLALDAPN
mmetsp:Transcript_16130/g.50452  ORF Transcript_16130/g.50452 Transcript_16130/m.50452 type:complete len:201 (-) Transcript_16130:1327-1929(-)